MYIIYVVRVDKFWSAFCSISSPGTVLFRLCFGKSICYIGIVTVLAIDFWRDVM